MSQIVPEILRNSNYKIWSGCMKDYLTSQELWGVVNGNSAEESNTAIWEKKNGMALHAIKISCEPQILSHIGSSERASDAWKHLERIQNKRDKGTCESLDICINTQPMDEGIEQHTNILTSIRKGKLKEVKEFIEENRSGEILKKKITSSGGTLLHAAILDKQVKIVKYLVSEMREEDLILTDNNLFTPLDTIAAQIGDDKKALKMAKYIAKVCPKLVTHGEVLTPILIASAHAHKEMTRYLYQVIDGKDDIMIALDPDKDSLHGTILLSHCITGQIFDVASKLLHRFPELASKQCAFIDPLQDLCKVPSPFSSATTQGFSCRLQLLRVIKFLGIFRVKFDDPKVIRSEAKIFLKSICKLVATFDGEKLKHTSVREAMLEAAKNGIVEFIKEIVRPNQRLLLFFDHHRRNIFSYAVIYRQEKVFNLIYGLSSKDRDELTNIVDSYDNNMLHLAARMIESSSTFQRTSGAALQMQRELQWFKEVEKLCKPSCREMLNQDGVTPRELFTKSHKELVKEGENWMKTTAQASSVVAALIITVTFATAFTFPGGNDQTTGYPIFISHPSSFKIFLVFNAISFFASLISVLMFLGILTSRYAEDDFLDNLPKKLIFGITTLCVSIGSMMATFYCALAIMLKGKLHIILPAGVVSLIPVLFFFFSSLYPLLYEICGSTWGRSIFDENTKFPRKKKISNIRHSYRRLVQLYN